MTRRQLLAAAGVTAVGGAAGQATRSRPVSPSSGHRHAADVPNGAVTARSLAPLPRPYETALPLPPTLRPSGRRDGATVYDLTERTGRARILPGLDTEVWGYDGIFPGPTIAARRGEPVLLRVRNQLAVPTSTHLHGGHTPAASDGFPTDLVLPEAGWPEGLHHRAPHGIATGVREHLFPNDQPAATLWYHDHRMDFTGPQVYRGLAGLFLLTDEVEESLPLPYGDRDIPLVLTDKIFAADGSLAYPSLDPTLRSTPGVPPQFFHGVQGDVHLVNGAPWPQLEVEAVRYRFRILNASNARVYFLTLDPAPPGGVSFWQVGSDGGLLEEPVGHRVLVISPAERLDVVVDFAAFRPGTAVVLRNADRTDPSGAVMRFLVARPGSEDATVPARLAHDLGLPTPGRGTPTRRFLFLRTGPDIWTVNLAPFDPDHPIAEVPLDRTEIWEFVSDHHHPIHVHLEHFRVLSRAGGRLAGSDVGRKDTVYLRPGETVRVAIRFSDFAGRFVMHCHNLEHEDMSVMAAFDVA